MPDRPVLDPVEQRVLGALLEKQRTVPDTYPLSLNALRAACNQSTSRDPVVAYDETTIVDTLGRLRDRELVRFVKPTGIRVVKYHQRLEEQLELDEERSALLTLLLLRGPQTRASCCRAPSGCWPSPIARASRRCCGRWPALDPPLVRELDRQPGQHDRRWIHLLGADQPEAAESAAAGRPRAGAGRRRRRPAIARSPPSTTGSPSRTPSPWATSSTTSRSTGGCWTGSPPRRPAVRASTSAADRARSPGSWPSAAWQ